MKTALTIPSIILASLLLSSCAQFAYKSSDTSPNASWSSTGPGGREYLATLDYAQLERTPIITFGPNSPAFTPFQAAALARKAVANSLPAYRRWGIDSINLQVLPTNPPRALYVVHFELFEFGVGGPGGWYTPQYHFYVPVLLDGTVILPKRVKH